jgi:hypothetical protein
MQKYGTTLHHDFSSDIQIQDFSGTKTFPEIKKNFLCTQNLEIMLKQSSFIH